MNDRHRLGEILNEKKMLFNQGETKYHLHLSPNQKLKKNAVRQLCFFTSYLFKFKTRLS